MNEETKHWYLSRTVIAAALTVVIALLGAFGVLDLQGEQENVLNLVMQIVTAVTGLVIIISRVLAKKKLTL